MRRLLLLFLVAHGALAASPFSGFYCGGGIGFDYFQLHNLNFDVLTVDQRHLVKKTSGDGFRGLGFVGWTASYGAPHLGCRLGYQGFYNARGAFFGSGVEEFWKEQGVFFDITPGYQLASCWYLHAILGVGFTQYRCNGQDQFFGGRIYRNQRVWSFLPRLGAGVEWAFWKFMTAGFEWTYNLPGRPIWYGPSQGQQLLDQNTRIEKFRGNQFAFTLNWYFYR